MIETMQRKASTARVSPYATPRTTVPPLRNLTKTINALEKDVKTLAHETDEMTQLLKTQIAALEYMYEEALDATVDMKDHNLSLLMQLRQRDDRLAQMYRKCLLFEEHLMQAERLLHELENQDEDRTCKAHCLCCFEAAEEDAILCSKGHRFCADCIDRRCAVLVDDPCYVLNCSIECMAMDDQCEGRIVDLMRVKHGRVMIGDYFVHTASDACLHAVKANPASLHFLRHDGSFRGLQCAKCNYGPLWNENCSELVSHHNQSIGDGGFIRNECPRCGWFVHDTRFLLRWDGREQVISQ